MDTAAIIAQIWALYFLLVSIWMLLKRDALVRLMGKVLSSEEHAFLVSLITLGLGIVLVINYSYWVLDWRLMITIIHWIVFVKGLVLLFFSDGLGSLVRFLEKTEYLSVAITINALLALYFLHYGFMQYWYEVY
jgi:hypothetical protein